MDGHWTGFPFTDKFRDASVSGYIIDLSVTNILSDTVMSEVDMGGQRAQGYGGSGLEDEKEPHRQ